MESTAVKDRLLGKLRDGSELSGRERLSLTMRLAAPAVLAQLSMCLMSCIDTAMVGRLGSAEAASVGLVSTACWLFGSFCYANSSGYSVQVAHRCGAGDFNGARRVFRTGLCSVSLFSLILSLVAVAISGPLPRWLGGSEDIVSDSSAYFLIYSAFIPVFQAGVFCEATLIGSGSVKVTSMASLAMCLLDVVYNYLFIFVAGMGVKGAALGTGLAELSCGAFLLWWACRRSPALKRIQEKDISNRRENSRHEENIITRQAINIIWPLWLQNIISRGAYIAATVLIAPMGTIAIAANSMAIIAEGFCYLPGYGMQDAATALVGQSLGAGRKKLAKKFAGLTITMGASIMGVLAVLMWLFAPQMMGLLIKDAEVISLGSSCLRIEAFAEVFYGISIVACGCCVGAGDTLMPSAINLGCMWVVRIGLALLLIPKFGLQGYWIAMASELCVKGVIFALRIHGDRWMNTKLTTDDNH